MKKQKKRENKTNEKTLRLVTRVRSGMEVSPEEFGSWNNRKRTPKINEVSCEMIEKYTLVYIYFFVTFERKWEEKVESYHFLHNDRFFSVIENTIIVIFDFFYVYILYSIICPCEHKFTKTFCQNITIHLALCNSFYRFRF